MNHPCPPRGQRGGQRACRASPALVSPLDPPSEAPPGQGIPRGETHPPTRGHECLAALGARVGPLGEARGPTGPGSALAGHALCTFPPRWPLPSAPSRGLPNAKVARSQSRPSSRLQGCVGVQCCSMRQARRRPVNSGGEGSAELTTVAGSGTSRSLTREAYGREPKADLMSFQTRTKGSNFPAPVICFRRFSNGCLAFES